MSTNLFDLSFFESIIDKKKALKTFLLGETFATQGFFIPYKSPRECLEGFFDILYAPFKMLLLSAIASAILALAPIVILVFCVFALGSKILNKEETYEDSISLINFSINLGLAALVLTPIFYVINLIILPVAAINFLGSTGRACMDWISGYYDEIREQEGSSMLTERTLV